MIFFFFNELVMSEVSADVNLGSILNSFSYCLSMANKAWWVMIKSNNWGWTDMDKPNL